MYWGIAVCLWLGGFLIGRFNTFNTILGNVSPARARTGWLPGKFLVPLFYRMLAWLLIIASIAVLYYTEALPLHWLAALGLTALLIFITAFFSSISAWRSFARKSPAAFEEYKARKEMNDMFGS